MNTIPDLAEIIVKFDHTRDDDKPTPRLLAELRIGTAEFNDEEPIFDVKAKRLYLDLELDGFSIEFGSRYGEPFRENEIKTKHTQQTESEAALAANASLSAGASLHRAPSGECNAGTSAKATTKTQNRSERTELTSDLRVKALGNNRWEITEFNGEPLAGTYLNGKKQLCRLRAAPLANRNAVTVTVIVKQKDLVLDRKANFPKNLTLTREKMLKIVIAKAISSNADKYNGNIQLSEIEACYEGV